MNNHTLSRREMLRVLALASATGAVAPRMLAAAEAPGTSKTNAPLHVHPQQQLQMGSEQIAILVYPEFTALDALGPHYFLAGLMGATVRFVAKTLDPVPCEGASKGGFCVKPHLTFADCPDQLDLLLVPGGLVGTLAAIEDNATINFLKVAPPKQSFLAAFALGRSCLARQVCSKAGKRRVTGRCWKF